RQAQSRAKKLAKTERIARDPRDGKALGFAFKPPERSGRVVLEVEHGEVGVAGRTLLRDVDFWLERGEHVSLVGANGSGKTTLIETLVGLRELPAGKLLTGHNVKLGYLSQHAEELPTGTARTVVEATQRAAGLTPAQTRALLGRFQFSGEDADKPLEGLSGGERRRLSLAILVSSGANVLILDEPTNHLDLESREALETALRGFEGAVLLVSHDRALLDAIGTRTIAVQGGGLRSYVGGWPEYVRVRAQQEVRPAATEPRPRTERRTRTERPRPAKRPGQSERAPKRNPPKRSPDGGGRAGLEARIEQAEAALAAVQDELSDPAAWATPEASARSTARHEEARLAVEELYRRWEAVAG
ncbi:MAG: ATP-binding cassette domain-containing protein, partial [Solirubrobacteraceae bacterium]